MVEYIFTNDLRITKLDSIIQKVSKLVQEDKLSELSK